MSSDHKNGYFILEQLNQKQKSGLKHYLATKGLEHPHLDVIAYIATQPGYFNGENNREKWKEISEKCQAKYGSNVYLFGGIVCSLPPSSGTISELVEQLGLPKNSGIVSIVENRE